MPLAFPMISGPGTITTVIVLSQDAPVLVRPIEFGIILGSVILTIVITYVILISSDQITKRLASVSTGGKPPDGYYAYGNCCSVYHQRNFTGISDADKLGHTSL